MSTVRLEAGATRITGRAPGGWIIGNRLYVPALFVGATIAGSLPGLTLDSLAALDAPDGADLIEAVGLPALPDVELLLLGTGARQHRPPPAFTAAARTRGWRVEAMDSACAARTFNVLIAEERQVAALLF